MLAGITALAVFSVCVATAFLLPKTYTASTQMIVDTRGSQLLGFGDGVTGVSALATEVETQAAIAVSADVVAETVNRLRLWSVPEFAPGPALKERVLDLMGIAPAPSYEYSSVDSISDLAPYQAARLISSVMENVSSRRVGLTSVVTIYAKSRDATLATRLADTLAGSYLDTQIDAGVETVQRAAAFLEERVKALSASVDAGERAIDAFVLSEGAENVPPELQEQVDALRTELDGLSSRQTTLQARLAAYRQFLAEGNVAVLPKDDAFADLLGERASLATRADTSAAIRERLREVDGRIETVVASRTQTVADELEAARGRSREVQQNFQTVLAGQEVPSDTAARLFRLQQDLETSRSLYASYVQRLEEVRQQETLALPNTRIASRALIPTEASFPPRMLILAVGLILAIGSGLSAAFLREFLIGGFASQSQFEAVTSLELAGVVPESRSQAPFLDVRDESRTAFSEAIRRLRVVIGLRKPSDRGMVVLVTSSMPGEGKSSLSLSLARAFALAGHRTTLIDADLRRPALSRMLGGIGSNGLTNFFTKSGKPSQVPVLVPVDEHTNITFVGDDDGHLNATESLVGGPRFAALIKGLKEHCDIIVLDSPPVNFVVDAQVMSRLADLIVYVVREDGPSQRAVLSGLRHISTFSGSTPVFPVLNRSRHSLSGYYTYEKDSDRSS